MYNWKNVKNAVKTMLSGKRTPERAECPGPCLQRIFLIPPGPSTQLSPANAGDGIAIGHRRITLSTCGVVPLIPNVGRDLGVLLAVSLHAANDDLRNEVGVCTRV